MRVLCVAAHPDDEVLGCGAFLAALADAGHHVEIAILGEGVTSRAWLEGKDVEAQLDSLHSAVRDVANCLGAKGVRNLNLPDNRFDTMPLLEIVRMVEKIVDDFRPDMVLTHHSGDLNVDHEITNRAVLTATRPTEQCKVRRILAFEIPSSTEWSFGQLERSFSPNLFCDVSLTMGRKLKAMEMYATEQRCFPHPRSRKALLAIARRWGSVSGFTMAEAFEIVREMGPPGELFPLG